VASKGYWFCSSWPEAAAQVWHSRHLSGPEVEGEEEQTVVLEALELVVELGSPQQEQDLAQ
jgi:hypothetical protein